MPQNDPLRISLFNFDADPDPAFHFDPDLYPDPASQNDADPDPQHCIICNRSHVFRNQKLSQKLLRLPAAVPADPGGLP